MADTVPATSISLWVNDLYFLLCNTMPSMYYGMQGYARLCKVLSDNFLKVTVCIDNNRTLNFM